MTGDLVVRQYTPADASQVLAVYETALKAHGWEFSEPAPAEQDVTDSYLGITAEYLAMGGEFLVGLREGEIIATGGFQPQDETTAEIRKMAVHPAHQRRGYGKRMLKELETRAEKLGFERLELETFERLTAVRRLYEKQGYEVVSRHPDAEFGEDRIRYRKDFRDGRLIGEDGESSE